MVALIGVADKMLCGGEILMGESWHSDKLRVSLHYANEGGLDGAAPFSELINM